MGREVACCCVSFTILFLAFLALVAGVGSPFWYILEDNSVDKIHGYGPLSICVEKGSTTECYTYSGSEVNDMTGINVKDEIEDEDWRIGSMSVAVVGVGLGFLAMLTAMFPPVSSVLQMVAGLCGAGGSIWFMIKIDDSYTDDAETAGLEVFWSWGFFLAVVGGGLMFLNGVGLAILAGSSRCSMSPLCCCCGDRRHKV